MIGGLLELSQDGLSLRKFRGFIIVHEKGVEVGRVPLDDITALLLTSRQATLTTEVINALQERGAIIVHCGANYHPLGLTVPLADHFAHAGILKNQIAISEPLKKRLWQKIVREKINSQRGALMQVNPSFARMADFDNFEKRVRSGDPENMEAQAARLYWPAFMGKEFRREQHGSGVNGALNYGYAILRAATARAVVGTGLHPALGLHHSSAVNAFQLVDDLMEPFRPMVDLTVRNLWTDQDRAQDCDLTPDDKRQLAAVLQRDLMTDKGVSPLIQCLAVLARSLVHAIANKTPELEFPLRLKDGDLFQHQ
jgi:CRISP-associated protein Cas1